MAKVVRFHKYGGPEILKVEDVPNDNPGPGQARLKILAAGINRDQFSLMAGEHFRGNSFVAPKLPSRIGYEAAGIVESVGEGVDNSWVGKSVSPFFGLDQNIFGLLGESAIIPAEFLQEYPAALTVEQAAIIWVPYLTAYGGLVDIGRIKKGDFVTLTAASSSVALAAIQIAKSEEAIVIAVTRTPAKKEALLSYGAHHVIVTDEEDYADRVQEITGGKGVNITFDALGGPFLEELAQAAAVFGIIIEYGMLSGKPAPFPVFPVVGKGLSIRGYTVSEITRDIQKTQAAKKYILERIVNRTFKPEIAAKFPLDSIIDAYRYIKTNEQMGRVVITM